MTTQTARPISYVLVVAAIVLAAGLAVVGTVLGALTHSSPGLSGEGGRPVYLEYGWPVAWQTNAPGQLIVNTQNGNYPYGEDGYAPAVFLGTTIMWFLAALTAEALLWALVHYLRLLLRYIAGSLKRSSPSSTSLPP